MITKDEWASLSGSQAWAAFKGYLWDFRAKMAEAVINGNVPASERDEAIFRAQTMKDIADMDWPTIAKFYNIPLEPIDPKDMK